MIINDIHTSPLHPPRLKAGTYKTLDAWRGVACLWVVMIHACLPVVASRYHALRLQPLYAFSLLGGLGVQLFFVISGYCITNAAASSLSKGRGVVYFVEARLRRIYPPYFFSSLFAFSLSFIAAFLVRKGYLHASALASTANGHQGWLYYLSALTLTQVPLHQKPILAVFWTLCYEVAFYCVVSLMLVVGKRRASEQVLLNCLHIVTVLCLFQLIAAPEHCCFPFDLWPQFGLGVLVYDLVAYRHKTSWLLGGLVVVELAVFTALHNYGNHLGQEGSRVQFLFSLVFALLLVALANYDDLLKQLPLVRAFSWIGQFSYSLYLTHLLTLGLVMQIATKMTWNQSLFIVPFFVQIVLAVFVARIFFVMCEQPYLNNNAKFRLARMGSSLPGGQHMDEKIGMAKQIHTTQRD